MKNSPTEQRRRAVTGQSEPLSADAVLWLKELPETVRPLKTCARFPRIVNKLVILWGSAADGGRFFDDLLLDRRGDRQGFPMEIAFELAALKNYFETVVHPSKQTVWDDIAHRGRGR